MTPIHIALTFGSLAASVVGLAALAATPLGHPDLFKHATQFMLMPSKVMSAYSGPSILQPWISEHELFCCEDGAYMRYDLDTGEHTALAAFTRAIAKLMPSPSVITVSPDGKWALCGESYDGPFTAVSLDGRKSRQWSGGPVKGRSFWMPGGHWLACTPDPKDPSGIRVTSARVLRLDSSEPGSRIDLPTGLRRLEILSVTSPDHILARVPDKRGEAKTIPLSDNTMVIEIKETLRSTQELSLWSHLSPKPLREWKVRLPGEVQEVAVSPDGKRAAWLLIENSNTPGEPRYADIVSLWGSRIDGSDLREIGAVRVNVHAGPLEDAGMPYEIHWLPGGREIGFMRRSGLWTVSAD